MNKFIISWFGLVTLITMGVIVVSFIDNIILGFFVFVILGGLLVLVWSTILNN